MERIHVDVPEQPPNRSVVLGAGGTAWQRQDQFMQPGMWFAANGTEHGMHWSHLVVDCGPLDVVHRAEAT